MSHHSKSISYIFYVTLLILSFIVLSGCDFFNNPLVVMWTNHAELAAYVENYNSTQNKYKIEIVYKPNPAKALSNATRVPDIVIGPYLNSPSLVNKFNPLNRLFKEKKINSDLFYHELLRMCFIDKKYRVLPVSFNLPAIIFKRGRIEDEIEGLDISLDKIKELGKKFNRMRGKRVVRVGFSPYWEMDFLYYTAVLMGGNFEVESNGLLKYDRNNFEKARKFVSLWEEKTNFGFENEKIFREKYFDVPYYKLLLDGRILFYLTSSKTILDIPDEKRNTLDFRWLSYNDNIPVEDDILFVGIPSDSKNKKGGENFISWFFKPETQRKILKMNSYKRLRVLGICNGFSSLAVINERDMPKNNEMLLGHIPPRNFLIFPRAKSVDWNKRKRLLISEYFKSSKK